MKAWSRWQDWTNVVAGVWLFISPWIVGFTGHAGASWNAWIFGLVVAALALWALTAPGSRSVQWLLVIAAAWVFVAPWLLGFATVAGGAWNAWIVAVVVAIVAGWAGVSLGGSRKPTRVA